MLWQMVGDPTGQSLKLLICWITMVRCSYDHIMRVPRKKAQFKKQCPPVRLNIDGEYMGERKWKRSSKLVRTRAA